MQNGSFGSTKDGIWDKMKSRKTVNMRSEWWSIIVDCNFAKKRPHRVGCQSFGFCRVLQDHVKGLQKMRTWRAGLCVPALVVFLLIAKSQSGKMRSQTHLTLDKAFFPHFSSIPDLPCKRYLAEHLRRCGRYCPEMQLPIDMSLWEYASAQQTRSLFLYLCPIFIIKHLTEPYATLLQHAGSVLQ